MRRKAAGPPDAWSGSVRDKACRNGPILSESGLNVKKMRHFSRFFSTDGDFCRQMAGM